MTSRTQLINQALTNLRRDSSYIDACALVTSDGLLIASVLPHDMDSNSLGGVLAMLLQLGNRAANELDRGYMDQLIIHGENGYTVMCQASEQTTLVVMTQNDARLGMVLAEMNVTANEIAQIM